MASKSATYNKIRPTQPNKLTLQAAKRLNEMSKNLKNQVLLNKSKENESIYISGKITGENLENCRAKFKAAEEYLKTLFPFAKIVNPLELALKEFGSDSAVNWERFMIFDLKMLLDCQAVYFLADWTDSEGATLEHHIASKLNFDKIYQ